MHVEEVNQAILALCIDVLETSFYLNHEHDYDILAPFKRPITGSKHRFIYL